MKPRAVVNPAVEYVGYVLDDPATTLSTNARFVLAELARHWNRKTQTSWIGVSRRPQPGEVLADGERTGLMKTTGLSARAITYAFREIEASGLASSEPRAGTSSLWRFPLQTLDLATPAPGAPLHQVHPSTEWRGAPDAPTPARGAGTPAPRAGLPTEEPVIEPARPLVDQARPLRPGDVLRCPNLPSRRNAWCGADCELCHGMGHVHVEDLNARRDAS